MPNSLIPPFFYDSTKGDPTKEVLIDFFLSWTLRCARKEVIDINKKANKYAIKLLKTLLFVDNENLIIPEAKEKLIIKEIKTWKQSDCTDLWIEVDFENGERYALLIENKVYTSLSERQLLKYKGIFDKYCKNNNYIPKYVFITCHESIPYKDKKHCEIAGFNAWTLGSLQRIIISDIKDRDLFTGNDLFDEFWFRMWDSDLKTAESKR